MKNTNNYTPRPVDTSDVTLPDDLNELAEAIAKNVHEVWSEGRMAEGWTYGPQRNDELKQNPCLVEYELLPDSEKEYDRATAMGTLRLICKLGFDIVKRNEDQTDQ